MPGVWRDLDCTAGISTLSVNDRYRPRAPTPEAPHARPPGSRGRGLALLARQLTAAPPDPQALAARIDGHIDTALKAQEVTPAGPANDAEFLRRAALDTLGRIPTVAEARAFLADTSPDRRERLVDQLLDNPAAVNHAAAVWRAALVP
jgi:hypothetical protein